MYETEGYTTKQEMSFTESLASIPESIERGMPSMDKRLARYMDAHMPHLISEWELVTQSTFDNLERRLDAVSTDIAALERTKIALKERVSVLEQALSEVEER